MLTQDEVLGMVVEVLKTDGPEDIRDQPYDQLLAEFKSDIEADKDGVPMVKLLMAMFNRAYEAGRQSVQI